MRESVATRVVEWMSGVVDIMREPSPTLPVRPVLALLARTFDHTAMSWNWSDPDGAFGMLMEPADALLAEDETLAAWLSGELLDCHALTAWFAITRDPAPYTLARVPSAIVPQRRRVLVERPLKRLGMNQQLSIVYRIGHGKNYAFVAARGNQDFDGDDLDVAIFAQRSIRSLDRQCQAIQRLLGGTATAGTDDFGLSGRELAVLQLLAEGDPTRVIARQLGCTPRTVEKHLEHIFRKLGVKDRLSAARVARLTGLVSSAPRTARSGTGPALSGQFISHRREPLPRRPEQPLAR